MSELEEVTLPERYIRMADGTILDAECGRNGLELWIWFRDDTGIAEAVPLVCDEEKMQVLTFVYPGNEIVYEGFTNVTDFKVDSDGKLSVRARKAGTPY